MINTKYDDLFFFINKMYTLFDQGYDQNTSLKDCNSILEEEGAEDELFSGEAELTECWKQFEILADIYSRN